MKIFATAASATLSAILLAATPAAFAEGREEGQSTALMRELGRVPLSLERGIAAGSREGTPVSAKYEIEDGGFQLSVITLKDDKFTEVIVDHKTGSIAKTIPITDSEDLAEVRGHGTAMTRAKRSLEAAIAAVVKAHKGYRAVSAIPALKDGRPVLTIVLLRGTAWKSVNENLD
jgi:hypothetical protein